MQAYRGEAALLKSLCQFHGKQHLQEQLVPANIADLNNEMKVNKELETFLKTKATDLPEEYLRLIEEWAENIQDKTLLDVIQTSLSWRFRGTLIKSFFSKAGDQFTGFAAYIVKGNEVIEIKAFSFDPNMANPTLIRDLRVLLTDLLQQYVKVSWTAREDNKASRIYQEVVQEFGGSSELKDGLVYYCVESSKKRD